MKKKKKNHLCINKNTAFDCVLMLVDKKKIKHNEFMGIICIEMH